MAFVLGLLVALLCYMGKDYHDVVTLCKRYIEEYEIWTPLDISPLEAAMQSYKPQEEFHATIEKQIKQFKMDKCQRFEII